MTLIRVPALRRWIWLCALAEAVGMTAAATAAKSTQLMLGEHPSSWQRAAALGVVVGGGLVEGLALGMAQSIGLSGLLGRQDRARWVRITLLVAGLGWGIASAPSALAPEGGDQPPLLAVLGGAACLGVVMGLVLGAAQGRVLRRSPLRPRRWVAANMLAWAVAMPVIFAGATAPSSDWNLASVVLTGTATGLAAGAALGLVSGLFLPRTPQPALRLWQGTNSSVTGSSTSGSER